MSNHYIHPQEKGYNIRYSNGEVNLTRFINTLDYSLDLIKLRDVYTRVFRRADFSWVHDEKEYTQNVINVTFNYAIKEYNRVWSTIYIKNGYNINDIELTDGICIIDDKLIAINTGIDILSPAPEDVLGKFFYYSDGRYYAKTNISTIKTVAELRYDLYENGFLCDGIKYVRWKRSAGSARVGKCLFIREELYKRIHKWDLCGLNIKYGDPVDLASLESYISLTTSSIIDTIDIDPSSILVIDDYESVFKDNAAITYNTEEGLETRIKEATISNSIWDGQSLIQTEAMGKYKNYGMLLLRQRFFKSCCFNCDIQKWFKDNNITEVSQLNGWTLADSVDQIKLITTPSSIKYNKLGNQSNWFRYVDSTFGVVKHDKPTHYFDGRMVQIHYQLINTLPLSYEEVGKLLAPSFDYVTKLKMYPEVVRMHIKYPENVRWYPAESTSRNDIVYKFLGINSEFAKTKIYRDWLKDLTKSYISQLRKGKILVNGNYETLCGNPYEMLEQSIGIFDGTSKLGIGNIYTKRFSDGVELIGSRSPHVAAGNLLLTKNKHDDLIDKYFNFTEEIVCINSINENILECLSGADFDSDTMLITDNSILLNAAKRIKGVFPVPTRLVEAEKLSRKYTFDDLADLDIKTSVNKIGEIINCSQELNSKYWQDYHDGNYEDLESLYCDIAQLDVMSNMAIDSAKRLLPVDLTLELKKISKRYENRDDNGRLIKPYFFEYLAKDKGFYIEGKKNYLCMDTPMDYVQSHIDNFKLPRYSTKSVALSDILCFSEYSTSKVWYPQINLILDIIREYNDRVKYIWNSPNMDAYEKYNMSQDEKTKCVKMIDSMQINSHTMFKLVSMLETKDVSDIRGILMYILFCTHNKDFYQFVMKSRENVPDLIEVPNGNIRIYDFRYVIAYPNKNIE